MGKSKLLRILTFSILSCGLFLFSVVLLNNAREDNAKNMSYNLQDNVYSSLDKEISTSYSLDYNDESFVKERVVVFLCEGCKTDVVALVPESDLKTADWNNFILKSDGVPAWILGKGSIPYAKKVNCSNLTELYSQTMMAANMYRTYSMALKNGASLVKVSKSGAKTYKPGSKEHTTAKKNLYRSMNLSFTTTEAILKKMKPLNCIKSKKK